MFKRIRIYQFITDKLVVNGLAIRYEIKYIDFDLETGELLHTGTEDYSPERARDLNWYYTYVWDGVKKNKGGYRWFTERRHIILSKYTSKKEVKELIKKSPELQKILYIKENVEMVDLRKGVRFQG